MGIVLQFVGYGWAIAGPVLLFLLYRQDPMSERIGEYFLLTMVAFVLPGLLLGGFGSFLWSRRRRRGDEQVRIDAAVKGAIEKERSRSPAAGDRP